MRAWGARGWGRAGAGGGWGGASGVRAAMHDTRPGSETETGSGEADEGEELRRLARTRPGAVDRLRGEHLTAA